MRVFLDGSSRIVGLIIKFLRLHGLIVTLYVHKVPSLTLYGVFARVRSALLLWVLLTAVVRVVGACRDLLGLCSLPFGHTISFVVSGHEVFSDMVSLELLLSDVHDVLIILIRRRL